MRNERSELARAVEPERPSPRPALIERRTKRRYSLTEPAIVEVASWPELVTLYTKDISCGGMFVQTDAPPDRHTHVGVQLLLPDGAGTLELEGVVVHVVTAAEARATGHAAGFGLQFSNLTPDRRRALERLVEQSRPAARPAFGAHGLREVGSAGAYGEAVRTTLTEAEHRVLQELRAELALMMARSELEVLGLDRRVGRPELRAAFDRAARRWHPSATCPDSPPEIRRIATEILRRVQEAYRRLREATPPVPRIAPGQAVRGAGEAPRHHSSSQHAVLPLATARHVTRELEGMDDEPSPPRHHSSSQYPALSLEPARRVTRELEGVDDEPSPPRHHSSSQYPALSLEPARRPTGETERVRDDEPSPARPSMAELQARSEQLAAQLKRRAPEAAAPTRDENRAVIDEALQLVAAKRYPDAIERIELVLQRAPSQRLRVLLCVVQARQALTERDFPRARARYEAVLELDPENEVAQRELLMLSALRR